VAKVFDAIKSAPRAMYSPWIWRTRSGLLRRSIRLTVLSRRVAGNPNQLRHRWGHSGLPLLALSACHSGSCACTSLFSEVIWALNEMHPFLRMRRPRHGFAGSFRCRRERAKSGTAEPANITPSASVFGIGAEVFKPEPTIGVFEQVEAVVPVAGRDAADDDPSAVVDTPAHTGRLRGRRVSSGRIPR